MHWQFRMSVKPKRRNLTVLAAVRYTMCSVLKTRRKSSFKKEIDVLTDNDKLKKIIMKLPFNIALIDNILCTLFVCMKAACYFPSEFVCIPMIPFLCISVVHYTSGGRIGVSCNCNEQFHMVQRVEN